MIAFVGSVFSPYYFAARAAGPSDPMAHCCLNVCLYLPGASAWTMTERGEREVTRSAERFAIGPSALDWDGVRLRISVDERTAVLNRPLRGEIVVTPGALARQVFALGAAGRHLWRPMSVDARVKARFEAPGVTWSGSGYLDHNAGSAPLDRDFRLWDWSRVAADEAGRAQVFYAALGADGTRTELALELGPDGARPIPPPPRRRLAPTIWGLARETRGCGPVRVVRTFEDTPFYARTSLRSRAPGRPPRAMMHERLALDRFRTPAMQWALPYRIPRS